MHGSNWDREKLKKMQSLSTYRQIVSMTGFKHISNFNRPFKVTVASGDAGVLFRNVKSKLNTNVSSCIRFPLMRATDETPSPSCVHMDVDLLPIWQLCRTEWATIDGYLTWKATSSLSSKNSYKICMTSTAVIQPGCLGTTLKEQTSGKEREERGYYYYYYWWPSAK